MRLVARVLPTARPCSRGRANQCWSYPLGLPRAAFKHWCSNICACPDIPWPIEARSWRHQRDGSQQRSSFSNASRKPVGGSTGWREVDEAHYTPWLQWLGWLKPAHVCGRTPASMMADDLASRVIQVVQEEDRDSAVWRTRLHRSHARLCHGLSGVCSPHLCWVGPSSDLRATGSWPSRLSMRGGHHRLSSWNQPVPFAPRLAKDLLPASATHDGEKHSTAENGTGGLPPMLPGIAGGGSYILVTLDPSLPLHLHDRLTMRAAAAVPSS